MRQAASVSGTTTCGSGQSIARLTSAPAAPRRGRIGDEVVAVETLAAQRDEQRTRLELRANR